MIISIHALLAESDGGGLLSYFGKIIFLSTLSLRRATQSSAKSTPEEAYFYPRSPCGERQFLRRHKNGQSSISIHALLAESDQEKNNGHETTPCISIHALLAESDANQTNIPVRN